MSAPEIAQVLRSLSEYAATASRREVGQARKGLTALLAATTDPGEQILIHKLWDVTVLLQRAKL